MAPATTAAFALGAMVIGAVLPGPPTVVTVALAACDRLLVACRPVAVTGALDAALPVTGVATLLGAPSAPATTAQLAPELAPLLPTSWMATEAFDATLTGAWFEPPTDTACRAVVCTSFAAVMPVAVVVPELAVVIPSADGVAGAAGGVGTSTTLTPEPALAALESVTLLVCVFLTLTAPVPPEAAAAPTWLLSMLVFASPA
jgi:hypothetical protein